MQKSNLERDYASLIPTIKYLSLAAQFLSGATASVGIYVVILEKIPIPVKLLAITFTIILTFIIIGSFEGGIRKLFPYWIRQILNWLFEENQEDKKPKNIRIVLFVMLCILLVPLIIGTTIASWKASPDLVAYASPTPSIKELDIVAQQLDNSSLPIIYQFDADISRDSIRYQKQFETEEAKWDALIEAEQVKRKKYLRLYSNGHNWAKGSAAKIKNTTIPNLKIKKQDALSQINKEQSNSMDSLRFAKQALLRQNQADKSRILQSTQVYNESTLFKSNNSIEKWGGFLAVLAIVATFFTLFCLSFVEAYKAGILPNGRGVVPSGKTHKSTHKSTHKLYPNLKDEIPLTQTPVPQYTPISLTPKPNTNTQKEAPTIVFIEKLVKRTRQQYKRGFAPNGTPKSRAVNRQKALENIGFLRSLGIQVIEDEKTGRLQIEKQEVE